jgi:beta-lactamase regulating signal transducer with metallopeptidase domain
MSSTLLTTSPIWTAVGWTMLHLVWVGAAIGLVAALMRRLLKSARSKARYVVALTCLLALAFTPVLIFVRVFEPDSGPRVAMMRSLGDESTSPEPITNSDPLSTARPILRDLAFDQPVGTVTRSRLDFIVPCLPWFWLCGSLSTLAMLATGLFGVEQLRRSSRLVESVDLPRSCRALADSLGIARRVSVGICDRLAMPVLIGIVRPMILLPPAALSGWSVEQLEMVLLHELAHLRRWDNLVNLLQRLVESLLFFHPVVWWLSGWVRLERELCCDRLVVERVGRPVAYAEMLVALAGSNHRGRQTALAMADRQVLTRIRRLLNLEERSMKLSVPEGLGLLGAVVVGASLVIGSQAAQTKVVDDSEPSGLSVPGTAVDDSKNMPAPDAIPASEQSGPNDTGITAPPTSPKPVPPKNPRSISLLPRDERRVQIVQLPTTPEGVATYKIRGGIKIVCKSQKVGTISMEADEAVIKRVERQSDKEAVIGPSGETWFEEADRPMEVLLTGNVIFRPGTDKTAGKGDQRTVDGPQLHYDFVTGRLDTPPIDPQVADHLTPVPPSGQRATNIFARDARSLQITQLTRTVEGVVTLVCKGGIRIVTKSLRFGTVSMEADEAVIVRNLYRRKGETVSGPGGATWVEEEELPMEVQLKGDVILRQEQEKTPGKGEQRTFRAREIHYNFVEDHVLALRATLEVAARGLATPIKIVSPRIEQFHPGVRQPDGSFARSEHCEIRASGDSPAPKALDPSSPPTKARSEKAAKP